MNTIELAQKALNDSMLSQCFLGVFASNKIPKISKVPAALIVNLDENNLPGSHWIGMFFTKTGKCEFFDSYGRKPDNCILQYITQHVTSYTYNNICVQDLWSISCGQMCLYFLIWRCRGISFKKIIKSMHNDAFITGFVDSL